MCYVGSTPMVRQDRTVVTYVMSDRLKDDSALAAKPAGDATEREARIRAAADRALAEAKARRAEIDARVAGRPKEIDGRKGPEPVRYGDWEVKGSASDF